MVPLVLVLAGCGHPLDVEQVVELAQAEDFRGWYDRQALSIEPFMHDDPDMSYTAWAANVANGRTVMDTRMDVVLAEAEACEGE